MLVKRPPPLPGEAMPAKGPPPSPGEAMLVKGPLPMPGEGMAVEGPPPMHGDAIPAKGPPPNLVEAGPAFSPHAVMTPHPGMRTSVPCAEKIACLITNSMAAEESKQWSPADVYGHLMHHKTSPIMALQALRRELGHGPKPKL